MHPIVLIFILCLLAAYAHGYCTVPPRGAVTFCEINDPIYHINEVELDSYWTVLDLAAEKLSRTHESQKCQLPECKKYECGMFFLKCNSEEDAPLRTCRSSCQTCMQTCSGNMVHPGLQYLCDSDRKLSDGPCSFAVIPQPSGAMFLILLLVAGVSLATS